ncbi:MAG: SDR family NAD(P)-dependent oxidoreductase [Chloroflexi bacterium]|nr:SDR family NAD(P)-dependent oxidoreductase [Chloroflexota bacterium]
MNEFRGKTAVVTGGAGGIGRAMALTFADEGMNVVIADVDMETAAKTAAEIEAKGVRCITVQTDVADRASVGNLADRAFDEMGGVHILCNNAGVVSMGPAHTLSDSDWDWVIGVDLLGVIYGIQAFLKRMVDQDEECHIVGTASIAGLVAHQGIAPYNVAKFGVVALTETLRVDLADTKVSASVLCPGGVRTRIMESDRNRPQDMGGPGDFEARAGAMPPEPIDPMIVGRRVLDAIKANAPYIVTHKEQKAMVEGRFNPILEAFDRL